MRWSKQKTAAALDCQPDRDFIDENNILEISAHPHRHLNKNNI